MKHNPFLIHARGKERAAEFSFRGLPEQLVSRIDTMMESHMVHVENLTVGQAHRFQQVMQSFGGDAFLSTRQREGAEILLVGTRAQLNQALQKILAEDADLAEAVEQVKEVLAMSEQAGARRELVCGKHVLPLGERTLVMGILNVTPDSFSDGGKFDDVDRAVAHARAMVEAGADLIDIGGESTRPGYEPVSVEEELDRVLPVIRILSEELNVPLSIDTYKAEVAERAIAAGAHIINDIWGAKRDRRMAEVAARHKVPIILMHNREEPKYDHFFADFIRDLRESIQIALDAGVSRDQIILDPGIGFAKTLEHNLEAMRRLDDLVGLGYPVLLATSRKSMIGKVLDLPVDQRLEGTAATVALGVAKGCHMVRVHDVKEMKRVTTMMDAMLKGGISVG